MVPAQLDGANRCLRFYVCDFAGVQLSPNYMVFGNTLVADDSVVGLKRYWRPYFIELVALRELKPQGLLSSHSYRDVNSGMLCKTYAVSLPDDRLLLIDYQENERLAWLDRTFSPSSPVAGSASSMRPPFLSANETVSPVGSMKLSFVPRPSERTKSPPGAPFESPSSAVPVRLVTPAVPLAVTRMIWFSGSGLRDCAVSLTVWSTSSYVAVAMGKITSSAVPGRLSLPAVCSMKLAGSFAVAGASDSLM